MKRPHVLAPDEDWETYDRWQAGCRARHAIGGLVLSAWETQSLRERLYTPAARYELNNWEREAHQWALALLDGRRREADYLDFERRLANRITRQFGFLRGLTIDSDPRGPQLKIAPRHAGDLERDMGGYGLLAPEVDHTS